MAFNAKTFLLEELGTIVLVRPSLRAKLIELIENDVNTVGWTRAALQKLKADDLKTLIDGYDDAPEKETKAEIIKFLMAKNGGAAPKQDAAAKRERGGAAGSSAAVVAAGGAAASSSAAPAARPPPIAFDHGHKSRTIAAERLAFGDNAVFFVHNILQESMNFRGKVSITMRPGKGAADKDVLQLIYFDTFVGLGAADLSKFLFTANGGAVKGSHQSGGFHEGLKTCLRVFTRQGEYDGWHIYSRCAGGKHVHAWGGGPTHQLERQQEESDSVSVDVQGDWGVDVSGETKYTVMVFNLDRAAFGNRTVTQIQRLLEDEFRRQWLLSAARRSLMGNPLCAAELTLQGTKYERRLDSRDFVNPLNMRRIARIANNYFYDDTERTIILSNQMRFYATPDASANEGAACVVVVDRNGQHLWQQSVYHAARNKILVCQLTTASESVCGRDRQAFSNNAVAQDFRKVVEMWKDDPKLLNRPGPRDKPVVQSMQLDAQTLAKLIGNNNLARANMATDDVSKYRITSRDGEVAVGASGYFYGGNGGLNRSVPPPLTLSLMPRYRLETALLLQKPAAKLLTHLWYEGVQTVRSLVLRNASLPIGLECFDVRDHPVAPSDKWDVVFSESTAQSWQISSQCLSKRR